MRSAMQPTGVEAAVPAVTLAEVGLDQDVDEVRREVSAAAAGMPPAPSPQVRPPRSPEEWCAAGDVLRADGKLDEAIDAYREAARLRPESSSIRQHLGIALSLRRRFAEAIEAFSAVAQLRPDDPHAHNNLGAALRAHGKP